MATIWDITLARGRTATIPYTVNVGGVPFDLTGVMDIRWLAKPRIRDSDTAPTTLVKSLLTNTLTILSLAAGTFQFTLTPSDTAPPAYSSAPGTITLFMGLVLYLPGSPTIEYDLFSGQIPTLTLIQGVELALS